MKEELTKKAIELGYKTGTILYCMLSKNPTLIKLDRHDDFAYNDADELWVGGCMIYKKGSWAKIVPIQTPPETL